MCIFPLNFKNRALARFQGARRYIHISVCSTANNWLNTDNYKSLKRGYLPKAVPACRRAHTLRILKSSPDINHTGPRAGTDISIGSSRRMAVTSANERSSRLYYLISIIARLVTSRPFDDLGPSVGPTVFNLKAHHI